MEHVFQSYAYRPHPDNAAEMEALRLTVRRAAETMDLGVLDGRDLGGRLLNAEIDNCIEDADALVAPDTAGGCGRTAILPDLRATEFQAVRTLQKPWPWVLHNVRVASVGRERRRPRATSVIARWRTPRWTPKTGH